MKEEASPVCENCKRLEAEVERLGKQLQELQGAVLRLQEQLAGARKNSSTSSKPPSSDIVKPPPAPPPEGQAKRSRGGQPGHPKHERALFPPEQVTQPFEHSLHGCPCCGGTLRLSGAPPRVVQQVDVEPARLTVEQHTCPEYWCDNCQHSYKADLPEHLVQGGLVGPRLTTLIAYLKGFCHASFSTIRIFLRDVLKVCISRGQLRKIIGKVTSALDGPYQEMLTALADEHFLNVDETGHKDNGTRMWTWCFRADLYTLFKIDPTRSADVLLGVLGVEFDGVLGCDYYGAYRRFMRLSDVRLQFCLAHLIRDVKFLLGLSGVHTRAYGQRLRDALKSLFEVIHKKDALGPLAFQARLQNARDAVLVAATEGVPGCRHCQNLAARFNKHGRGYFEFITTPGIGPTNNLAEQAIRFVVIDRHITQGTRSEAGQRWCERIWSVIASCAQQGRGVFDYLEEAVRARFYGGAAPSLLPGEVNG
jgi:transposase